MKTLIKTLLFLFIICLTYQSHAQEEVIGPDPSEVIVILNGGSRIEGKILHWENDLYIEIESTWGQKLRFYESQYKKVIQKSTLKHAPRMVHEYNFEEKGFYAAFRGQLITGNDGPRAKGVNGVGLSISAGYKIHRLLSVGGGIGWDQYIWNSGEELIPLFAEVTGYLQKSNNSLFYNLQTGYSIALNDDSYLLSQAKGGLMVYPSIGIRFGNGPIKYTLDLGYKFQDAEFTYGDTPQSQRWSEQDVKFKRLTLRFGILL